MILANVAAAEELEARRQSCMYRVHDAPDPEKVEELRAFLDETGIPGLALAKGQALKPELFNRVLRRAAATPEAALVNELVLRCQAQAAYSPNNIGHFGLALRRYAHFTSPIRRYADLIVHRALIAGANAAGPTSGSAECRPTPTVTSWRPIAEHISATERRAAAAERAAIERYRAMLLAGSIGSIFAGRISGVAEFGLFVTLSGERSRWARSDIDPARRLLRTRRASAPVDRAAIRSDLPDRRRGFGPARRSGRDRRPPRLSDRRGWSGLQRSRPDGAERRTALAPGRSQPVAAGTVDCGATAILLCSLQPRTIFARMADRALHVAAGESGVSSWGVNAVSLRPAARARAGEQLLLLVTFAACAERQALPNDPTGRLFARGLDEITDLYIAPVSSRKLDSRRRRAVLAARR